MFVHLLIHIAVDSVTQGMGPITQSLSSPAAVGGNGGIKSGKQAASLRSFAIYC